jgi:hypothetical protein
VHYLAWLIDACDLRPRLRGAVLAELGRRGAGGGASGYDAGYQHGYRDGYDAGRLGGTGTAGAPDWQQVLKRWWGPLVLKHHPDRGGDTAAMQALNDARDRLVALLRGGAA